MSEDFTLVIKKFDPTDPRLGRNVLHDSRSRRYAAPAVDPRELQSVRHTVNIPVMDQGNEGSCTGHAGTGTLASGAFWSAGQAAIGLDPHQYSRALYGEATKQDPWPGEFDPATGVEDTGSDGLSVAKVLHARGLISGYRHAFSLAATLTALAESAVLIGSSWHSSMFTPRADGKLIVAGPVEGGHEYTLDEIDVQRERVWIRNSWSPQWGLQGRAWLQWDDLGALLADYGDCTILVPLSEPPPVPEPVPPKKTDSELAAALSRLIDNRSCPVYMKAPARAWLEEFVTDKLKE